jgi:hypothetical protein
MSIDQTSIQPILARGLAIVLPFAFVAAVVVGATTSLLPQAAYATDYAWCTQREGAVQCDFTTRAQCMQTASGTGYQCIENLRLITRFSPRDDNRKPFPRRPN